MMKKVIVGLILGILISVTGVLAASVALYASPFPVVTLLSQEPNPAEPGEIVTLKFKILNNGTATEDDVKVELLEEFPLSIYSGDKVVNIGKLRAGQTGSDAEIVEFKVKVDEEAVEGSEEIDLGISYGKTKTTFKDFVVKIRTRDVVLGVQSIKTSPTLVAPGTEFRLSLVLENNADSLVRNVNAKLNLTGSGIPFAPTQSSTEGYVYQINSKTQKTIPFELIALPNADGGVYKIPLTLKYMDESGNEIFKDDLISLKISSEPELLVVVDSSEINKEQRSGTVSVRIVNRGLTDIKLLTATMRESDDFTLLSEKNEYVGNIDSDDFETADFTIELRSYNKVAALPLQLSYRDVTNRVFNEDVVVELRTESKGLIITIVSGIFSALATLTAIVLVLVGAYWFYKRRKKRRKG